MDFGLCLKDSVICLLVFYQFLSFPNHGSIWALNLRPDLGVNKLECFGRQRQTPAPIREHAQKDLLAQRMLPQRFQDHNQQKIQCRFGQDESWESIAFNSEAL